MSDCGLGTPLAQAARCGLLGPNFLAIHANYLEASDIAALGDSRSSVVHCPRSHAYFRHQPFPFRALSAAGVNVCLGTDSLASVKTTARAKPELDMFAEMRAFTVAHPEVPPSEILRLATQAGARALGWQDRIGGLFPQALADLITIPFQGRREDAYAAVTRHSGPISASMIDGQWIFPSSSSP
jgi:cytosine/adenosine deaminase-related metal-dependent hydrolase